MNIAAASPQPIFARASRASGQQQPCSPTRPATEWWQVGEQRFDSTADLVKNLQVDDKGARAEYHYKTAAQSQKPYSSYLKEHVVGGAVTGAILGAIGVVGINVLGVVASIMTAGFYGMFEGIGLLAPVAVCAGAGALIGGLEAKSSYDEFQKNGNTVYGTVMSNNGQLGFHVYDELQNRVDLAAHATAPVEDESSSPSCTPWWKQQGPAYND